MTAAKERGDAAFKEGDYATAVGHYSKAIFLDRKNPVLPLNRAAAYLKLNKFEDAERDSTTTLTLSPGNVKALYRRAQARLALGRKKDAEADLNEALTLDPKNIAVKQELEKLSPPQKETSPPRRRVPIKIIDDTKLSTPGASTSTNAEPKRRRVPIRIVNDSISSNSSGSLTTGLLPTLPLESKTTPENAVTSAGAEGDLMKPVATRTLSPPSVLATPSTAPAPSISPSTSLPPKKVSGGIFRAQPPPSDSEYSSSVPPTAPSTQQLAPQDTETAVPFIPSGAAHRKIEQVDGNGASRPIEIRTFFEFQREWNMRKTVEGRWGVLSSIPPSTLRSLFSTSLTPALLVSIIDTVSTLLPSSPYPSSVPLPELRTYTSALPSIERFKLTTMFMSEKEKEKARALLKGLGMGGEGPRKVWGV